MEAQREPIDVMLARVRELKRREGLHRQIAALERKLERIGPNPIGLRRDRYFRLMGKIKRLQGALLQPELML